MSTSKNPGVDRSDRISDEGLRRLEKQLRSGVRPSKVVLDQWVERYGDEASELIKRYRSTGSITDE